MRKTRLIVAALFLMVLPVGADDSDNGSDGLTPAMMNRWNESQVKYSRAITQYGQGSPEATEAEVLMKTTARELGIKPFGEIPQSANLDKPIPPTPETDLQSDTTSQLP